MRKCKTISFDTSDEIERELLEHAERKGNFSRYVKRLIEKDMNGLGSSRDVIDEIQFDEVEYEIEGEDNEDDVSGFI